MVHFELPPDLRAGLTELCRREGVTRFMAGLAAFALTLRRFGAGDDLVVGTPVALRDHNDVRDLVGCFLNEIPIRIQLAGVASYREAIRRVRAAALRAYDHAEVPLEMIARRRTQGGTVPLYDVMFELGSVEEPPRFPQVQVSRLPLQFGVALCDVTVAIEEHGDSLRGWLEYSQDLFTEDAGQALVAELRHALSALVFAPDSDPSRERTG
jgi:non-ribosomal peptide synthetase component F